MVNHFDINGYKFTLKVEEGTNSVKLLFMDHFIPADFKVWNWDNLPKREEILETADAMIELHKRRLKRKEEKKLKIAEVGEWVNSLELGVRL